MNTRIKELAGQAGYNDLIYEISSAGLEKFAHLIIEECALVANKAENNDNGFRCMYDVIHEHFGLDNDTSIHN